MHALLEVLRAEAPSFGHLLARTSFAQGLAVTLKDGSTRPVPITATPVVIDRSELRRRAELSARLASASVKMSRAVLAGPRRALLADALSPLERTIADQTYAAVRRLATVRVDYFLSGDGSGPRALEINATIPAMQGYSDIAMQALIEIVGRRAGLGTNRIQSLIAQNGSNASALYQALLEGFALERQGTPRRIGLLARRNDAQLTELRHLARRFGELGTEADLVFPDELSGDDRVEARGKIYDLIYRHLFVRRLEEIRSPYLERLFAEIPGRRTMLLNPPASQVEVKTTFALLSHAAQDDGLAREAALDESELEAIRETVPWTRVFRPGPATCSEGRPIKDLVAWVADRADRYVLKRAWDYGGKTVFIGRSAREDGFDERTRAAYGASLDWQGLCRRASKDPLGGGFVVQELVAATPEPHVLCSADAVQPALLYVDFSAYASVGLPRAPDWGGVCRGSPSQIVNIVGGGGVLPLITTDVADALLAALRASGNGPPAL